MYGVLSCRLLLLTGVHRILMKRIRQRQLAFLGHVLRKHGLEHLVFTEMIVAGEQSQRGVRD